MPIWIAALLGIVEGLTEFLPVSSTGHLIVVSQLLGLRDDASKAFDVVIQGGAILAVIVHYRVLLMERVRGFATRDPRSLKLLLALFAAFLPAAILGLGTRKKIKELLFSPRPVAIALIVGGVAMILIERWLERRKMEEDDRLEAIDTRRGLQIGFFQCLSLIPGTSRSMCTILGGRLVGMSRRASAEFSFLLAIPVLGAATALDLVKERHALFASSQSAAALVVGFVVSFIVALVVIRVFLAALAKHGLRAYGIYRIIIGAVILGLCARGLLA